MLIVYVMIKGMWEHLSPPELLKQSVNVPQSREVDQKWWWREVTEVVKVVVHDVIVGMWLYAHSVWSVCDPVEIASLQHTNNTENLLWGGCLIELKLP